MQRFALFIPALILLIISVMALWPEDELPPIKVGILHSLSGFMAISEKPVMQATLLAIEQINAQGGLLGRRIEPVIADGKSDWPTFARQAERLITAEKVSAVFGCWTSACRKMVRPVFEKHHNLLFYPLQYEGLEQSPNIIYTGATPNQQIIPAITWAMQRFGRRIYLVGSDYVFPHVANWLIRKQAALLQGAIIGEHYLPLDDAVMAPVINEIGRLHPDVVISTINGDANIAFFHALRRAGISADDAPVLSFSLGEAELAHRQNQDDAVGHFAAWNYFQSIEGPANRAFVSAYQTRFGMDQPLDDPMEAAWAGVHLWARAVQAAGSVDTSHIRQTIAHQSLSAPEGVISIDHRTHHAWKTVRIGRVRADGQFDILWSTDHPVRPAPYPALVSKQQADDFLAQLYNGWGKHWALPAHSSPQAGAAP